MLMTEQSSVSLKIAEVLNKASNAEKSEFDRRFKSFIDTKFSLKNLDNKLNHLKNSRNEKFKEQNKIETAFIVSLVFALGIGFVFSFLTSYEIQSFIFVCLIISVYSIKKDTYEKTYAVQNLMLELEIDRNNKELRQYGYLLMYENRITEDEPSTQGEILEKWQKQRKEAFDELKLEILNSMYLAPQN